jgi:hypothetical protein
MIQGARYVHTNLVAHDWRALAAFYERTLGCTPAPPTRDFAGPALEAGTGVRGASLQGVHLRLPATPTTVRRSRFTTDDGRVGAPADQWSASATSRSTSRQSSTPGGSDGGG